MSSPLRKNIPLSISANQNYKPRRLIPEEGRRPSSLHVGMGCGGRFCSGAQARTTERELTAKSCGPGAAMLAPSLWSDPQATVAKKPAHRGEREVSRKAIAQGMSECSPLTCMLVCAKCAAFGTRDRGCSAHPAFPAPSVQERDNEFGKLGQTMSREHFSSSRRRPGPIRCGGC